MEEDKSGQETGELVKCRHNQQKVITVIVTKTKWPRNRRIGKMSSQSVESNYCNCN